MNDFMKPLFDGVYKSQKWVENANQTQLKPIIWYTSWYFSRGGGKKISRGDKKITARFARQIQNSPPYISAPVQHLFKKFKWKALYSGSSSYFFKEFKIKLIAYSLYIIYLIERSRTNCLGKIMKHNFEFKGGFNKCLRKSGKKFLGAYLPPLL